MRCSTFDQNEARQMVAMKELKIPVEHIYIDKVSGKDFERPAYQSLLKKVMPGDLIYIVSIDRLGRNYDEIQNQWRILTKERGVDIVVTEMPLLDTRINRDLMGTFIADIVLQILSFVAHHERDAIRSRQAVGITAAKARGIRFGRPTIKVPDDFATLVKLWERGKISFSEVLVKTGLKQATFYNRLREYRREHKE